ncbi:hypothetical protein BT93_H0939 [Corymbia citriodora subsp. variegata]|nr:hypothetical protein BT93_H0939 [Corymbia citriodora subsp. variegata]
MYPRSAAASEAVPVEFVYVNPPEATSDTEAPVHRNSQVGMMPATVEPARQSSPGMAKTKLKSDSVVSHQGRGQVTQKEAFASKDLGRAVKVAPKTEPQKFPVTKTFWGRRNAPRKDQSREVKEKGPDINTQASNYISRAKVKIRTMSNAGGIKGAEQEDGGTDDFGNFIQRAKMKIVRTMTGIGEDKNAKSK